MDRDQLMGLMHAPKGDYSLTKKVEAMLDGHPDELSDRVAYMHVPMCESRCTYCPFYKNNAKDDLKKRFTDSTINLIDTLGKKNFIKEKPFDIFYFGGGSPTSLDANQLDAVLETLVKNFKPADGHEFTIESTVRHVTDEKLDAYVKHGVNRISLGVQSFDTDSRKRLGRKSVSSKVIEAVKKLQDRDIYVNVDLMFGLPGQSIIDYEKEIETALNLSVDNLSMYLLILFPHAPLMKMINKGAAPPLPSESDVADMKKIGMSMVNGAGYHMWNTKNACKDADGACRYIQTPYNLQDTVPLGSGAGGSIQLFDMITESDIEDYIISADKGELPIRAANQREPLNVYKSMLKGILKSGKLDMDQLGDIFDVDPTAIHRDTLKNMIKNNHAIIDDGELTLTDEGIHNFDSLAKELLDIDLEFKITDEEIRKNISSLEKEN